MAADMSMSCRLRRSAYAAAARHKVLILGKPCHFSIGLCEQTDKSLYVGYRGPGYIIPTLVAAHMVSSNTRGEVSRPRPGQCSFTPSS